MNKTVFKKSMMGFIIGVSAVIAPSAIPAAAPSAIDECAKELLLSYFPEPIVEETLKRFDIPQEKWAGITRSLSNKDKEVVKIVEDKANGMNPNPLKDPQQRQAAVKLFRETLLQVFTDALKENGITDTAKFQGMLDDIQQQKAKKFAMCMEKKKNEPVKNTAGNDSDDDDSDDDDEEEDDDADEKIQDDKKLQIDIKSAPTPIQKN